MAREPASWSGRGRAIGICAAGAFNGLAFDAHQTWAFWHAEAVGVVESPFRCANGTRATMVTSRALPPRLHGAERLAALMDPALREVLPALGALPPGTRAAMWLGLPERYQERAHASGRGQLERQVQSWCERHAFGAPVTVIAGGHASLARALVEACAELAAGRLDVAIAGGADTYHAPEVVQELIDQERLFDGKNLDSFIPGEGAAFLVLAGSRVAGRIGLPLLASVDAAAAGREPAAMFAEGPCTGSGLSQVMRAAALQLPAGGRRLTWLLGDLTNESYPTTEMQLALPRAVAPGGLDSGGREHQPIAAEAVRMDFLPLRFGDLGAATLPTAAVVAAEAFVRGAPEAESCLLMASSVGPERGAVLLSAGS